MRRNIVAGNWKSNELFSQADELINDIAEGLREFDNTDVDVIVCPPFLTWNWWAMLRKTWSFCGRSKCIQV